MNDSTAGESAEVEETEVTEEVQHEEATESAEVETESEDGEGEEEEGPGEWEFDFGGNALRVPKDKIPAELAEQVQTFGKGLWSDYTRKSQGIAEQAKSLQAREAAIQQMNSLQGEALNTYSTGLALRQEIEQLSQVNVNELWQSDPDRARQISDTINKKQAQFNDIVNRVSQYETQLNQTQAYETARRAEEGKRAIESRIKGFSKQAADVVEYVTKTYGIPKHEAETWPLNPAAAEMAYKAWQYDQLQAKTKKAASPKVEKVPVKPNKPFKSNSGAGRKDPDKMSVDEWVRWRRNQLEKKGG